MFSILLALMYFNEIQLDNTNETTTYIIRDLLKRDNSYLIRDCFSFFVIIIIIFDYENIYPQSLIRICL